MCYYNGVRVKREELLDLIAWEKKYEEMNIVMQSGFQYCDCPIIRNIYTEAKPILDMAHWEFIPFWYKDMSEVEAGRKKYTTLNAKGKRY